MRIAVFGSTGPTGQLVIKQALDKGYEVVAFARTPSKLNFNNENLKIVQGNLSDHLAIEQVIQGADAVLSTLGPLGNDKKNSELGDGYNKIIDAMKKYHVRRLIALGTASVKVPADINVFKFRLLVSMVKRLIPGSYKEIVRIGNIVLHSGLDFTLIRVAILTSGNATGNVKAGNYGEMPLGLMITRDDLARFFVNQIENNSFICKAPAVSN